MLKKIIKFVSDPKEKYPNIYIFGYHVLKALQKVLRKIGILKFFSQKNNGLPQQDTFNWSLYVLHYKGERKKYLKNYTFDLKPGDFTFKDGELFVSSSIKPLYPTYHQLYETITQINPKTVFEMGSGNGVNLHNLSLLLPDAELFGIDRLPEQIKYQKQLYPKLKANTKIADATVPFPVDMFPKAEVTFTAAVIMHIHTGNSHLTALANLFNMSSKYVVMNEKWPNHDYMNDIKKLHAEKIINWENLYFYYRVSNHDPKRYIMICSQIPLDYPVLTDLKLFLS